MLSAAKGTVGGSSASQRVTSPASPPKKESPTSATTPEGRNAQQLTADQKNPAATSQSTKEADNKKEDAKTEAAGGGEEDDDSFAPLVPETIQQLRATFGIVAPALEPFAYQSGCIASDLVEMFAYFLKHMPEIMLSISRKVDHDALMDQIQRNLIQILSEEFPDDVTGIVETMLCIATTQQLFESLLSLDTLDELVQQARLFHASQYDPVYPPSNAGGGRVGRGYPSRGGAMGGGDFGYRNIAMMQGMDYRMEGRGSYRGRGDYRDSMMRGAGAGMAQGDLQGDAAYSRRFNGSPQVQSSQQRGAYNALPPQPTGGGMNGSSSGASGPYTSAATAHYDPNMPLQRQDAPRMGSIPPQQLGGIPTQQQQQSQFDSNVAVQQSMQERPSLTHYPQQSQYPPQSPPQPQPQQPQVHKQRLVAMQGQVQSGGPQAGTAAATVPIPQHRHHLLHRPMGATGGALGNWSSKQMTPTPAAGVPEQQQQPITPVARQSQVSPTTRPNIPAPLSVQQQQQRMASPSPTAAATRGGAGPGPSMMRPVMHHAVHHIPPVMPVDGQGFGPRGNGAAAPKEAVSGSSMPQHHHNLHAMHHHHHHLHSPIQPNGSVGSPPTRMPTKLPLHHHQHNVRLSGSMPAQFAPASIDGQDMRQGGWQQQQQQQDQEDLRAVLLRDNVDENSAALVARLNRSLYELRETPSSELDAMIGDAGVRNKSVRERIVKAISGETIQGTRPPPLQSKDAGDELQQFMQKNSISQHTGNDSTNDGPGSPGTASTTSNIRRPQASPTSQHSQVRPALQVPQPRTKALQQQNSGTNGGSNVASPTDGGYVSSDMENSRREVKNSSPKSTPLAPYRGGSGRFEEEETREEEVTRRGGKRGRGGRGGPGFGHRGRGRGGFREGEEAPVCRYYSSSEGCIKGNSCPFRHV